MGTYYKNVEPWIEKIDSGVWVEIGVNRGEGSTQWFSDKAKTHNSEFHGVDMDPEQIQKAKQNLSSKTATIDTAGNTVLQYGDLPSHINLVTDRGEDFLLKFHQQNPDKKVSLAYLDNFDWDYWLGRQEEAFVAGVKQNYINKMGVEMTNINSQLTHLLQAIRLMPMMSENSVIICDDTWGMSEEGIFSGKCSAAIPFLMLHGYKLLHYEGYRQNSGAILGRFKQ
jgi:hypothetical protein